MVHSVMQHRRAAAVLAAVVVLVFGFWGCSNDQSPIAPMTDSGAVLSMANPMVRAAVPVQERHTSRLMADSEVIGTAVTLGDNGEPAILVLVTSERARGTVPSVLEGVRTKVVLTDKIVAMGKPGGGGGVSHTAIQTAPIQLGTSGGWRYDLANGYCCGGTLGSLISVGGQQRILSNYHVLEADIVSGGNNRVAQSGDFVIQPGLLDVGCNANNAQNVATLVKTSSLPGSNVDASTAAVISGMVRSDGAILEIGTISSSTVAASLNQKVKKSGRTSGLTRSYVNGLNASISVSYENECAGGAAFTKTFTGQILLDGGRGKFLQGGDSGSLLVEDVTTSPRAIGLLFAGSRTLAVANPINEVLNFFNASMVGN